ncbi:BON domain-containing protein [Tunturiibacter empetritectus]|uniref:Osmotically-inducible protein OsmY n=2 Tax=Tunturiibacter TaxID=3154218 RepID=A0A852VIQ2_9BACT|nr:BON domain-containing protein [Edaphobacter lichenicola]NYF91577.1 osmotically-inducible protein OsmY [Edaphobacter lichenicola]
MSTKLQNLRKSAMTCCVLMALCFLPVALPAQDQAQPAASPAADNSARNKARQTTADQQKENTADRLTSKKIRQSIMADKSLSTYAHNVKIITQDGAVTLKGPVKSEEERQNIASKTAAIVGQDKVTNQLTVKQ